MDGASDNLPYAKYGSTGRPRCSGSGTWCSRTPLNVDDIVASIFRALLGSGVAIPKAPACACTEIIAPVLRQRRNIMVKLDAEDSGSDIIGLREDDYDGSPVLKSLMHNTSQRSFTGLGPGFHEEFMVVNKDGNILKTDIL